MRVVGHIWQKRWKSRVAKEFQYRVDRIDCVDFSHGNIICNITCKLYPRGLLNSIGFQLFKASVGLTTTVRTAKADLDNEIEYQTHKCIQELRRMMELTINSGYATILNEDGQSFSLIPIMDNWRIRS